MPINYPGPFEVRINYTTNETPAAIAVHQLRLSCRMSITGDPGDPFSAWIPYEKSGSAVTNLATHVDTLVTKLRPFFATATDLTNAELWEYGEGSFDAVYRSVYPLGLNGASGSATQNASQAIMTLRTVAGGIMKVDLRGTIYAPTITATYPFAPGPATDLANYLISGNSIWWGRDNSYALVPLRWMAGQNEKAWRTAFRP